MYVYPYTHMKSLLHPTYLFVLALIPASPHARTLSPSCTNTYNHTQTHAQTHTHTRTHMHAVTHMHMHKHTNTHVYPLARAHTHKNTYMLH